MAAEERDKEAQLPPLPELECYLKLIRESFIYIRAYGRADGAVFCGLVASALHNLPDLLLRYPEFDQERFWEGVRMRRQLVPDQFRGSWDALFGTEDDMGQHRT